MGSASIGNAEVEAADNIAVNKSGEADEVNGVPKTWVLAARLFTGVLDEYMKRQLFYSSIVPLFEKHGLATRDGRFTYIKADLDDWKVYAAYRRSRIAATDPTRRWLKRRPWSFEDLELALEEQRAGRFTLPTETA